MKVIFVTFIQEPVPEGFIDFLGDSMRFYPTIMVLVSPFPPSKRIQND